jgi:hypothetical protein
MRNNLIRGIASTLLVLGLALASHAWSAAGAVTARTLTVLPGGSSQGFRPIVLADGKILVAGGAQFGTQQMAVTRLDADGSVDATYGTRAGTTDPNEYYTLIQFGFWHGEGVDGYILPTGTTGTVPLYRLLYPYIAGLHHWTVDQNEYDTLTTQYGWVGEGGTGFVIE